METNLEQAKRRIQANANLSGFKLPEGGFIFKMLELAAQPDPVSERQTKTEPESKAETKPLIIADVSKQRELLIAFYNHIQENDIDHNIPQRIEKMVDTFLKSNL